MTLLGDHRRIEKRKTDELQAENNGLRMQLMQRDAVLFAIIKKSGSQMVTFEELGLFHSGCAIVATPDQNEQRLVFSVVEGVDEVIAAANEVARQGGDHIVAGEETKPMDAKGLAKELHEEGCEKSVQ